MVQRLNRNKPWSKHDFLICLIVLNVRLRKIATAPAKTYYWIYSGRRRGYHQIRRIVKCILTDANGM